MKSLVKRVSATRYRIKKCRICHSEDLHEFLSLGTMPIPNGFISKNELSRQEFYFPLKACVCKKCWLVQLTHVIPADIMFKNYLYIPSTSSTVVSHFNNFADAVVIDFNLKSDDLVVDIGSNDGTLLSAFQKKGIKVLGVDPAENIVKVANKAGIPTKCAFFNELEAEMLRREYGEAKVISGTNVIAHIDNLHDLVLGVKQLLSDDGVFIMEAPYLSDLIERNEFDTIYHEHLSYFSVRPLVKLFEMYGLKIIDIQKQKIHGGSIRVFATKKESTLNVHPRVQKFVIEEQAKGLCETQTYDEFTVRVKRLKSDLLKFLKSLRKEDKSVAAYGAAAKGNVLLNYYKLGTEEIDFIVDSISYKQGKFTPGTHIPIFPESQLLKKMPDYTLILAWNFAEEIIEKNKKYQDAGGRFIIPVPYLKVI